MALLAAALFFVLTPGILLTLPLRNKFAVAAGHGVVFVVIMYFVKDFYGA